MAHELVMPVVESGQEAGTLIRWLKADGDVVNKGEPLMEVETDKAQVEIESPESGILSRITARPGTSPASRPGSATSTSAMGNQTPEPPPEPSTAVACSRQMTLTRVKDPARPFRQPSCETRHPTMAAVRFDHGLIR